MSEVSNTEILCSVLGWQGATVHQVADELNVKSKDIIEATPDDMRKLMRRAISIANEDRFYMSEALQFILSIASAERDNKTPKANFSPDVIADIAYGGFKGPNGGNSFMTNSPYIIDSLRNAEIISWAIGDPTLKIKQVAKVLDVDEKTVTEASVGKVRGWCWYVSTLREKIRRRTDEHIKSIQTIINNREAQNRSLEETLETVNFFIQRLKKEIDSSYGREPNE